MPSSDSASGVRELFHRLFDWLVENPALSYWVVLLSASFVLLLILYLFVTNIRLHAHIRMLNKDKLRLMEEKDLIRRGAKEQSEGGSPQT
jgi:hypothetical protein